MKSIDLFTDDELQQEIARRQKKQQQKQWDEDGLLLTVETDEQVDLVIDGEKQSFGFERAYCLKFRQHFQWSESLNADSYVPVALLSAILENPNGESIQLHFDASKRLHSAGNPLILTIVNPYEPNDFSVLANKDSVTITPKSVLYVTAMVIAPLSLVHMAVNSPITNEE